MSVAADSAKLRGRLLHDAPMSRYSSWRAGGSARVLFMPADADDLAEFWSMHSMDESLHFIGLGSNLLVRDGGVFEPVVRMAPGLKGMELTEEGMVYAEAGVAMPRLAKFAASNQLGQAGFMAGIPGSVGGALAMNAGCFGFEVWERVHSATLIDDQGAMVTLPASQFTTGYRSVKHGRLAKLRFVAARFSFAALQPGELDSDKQVMETRVATQPIGTANAGSVFVNPPNDSAGRLIQSVGLAGHTVGAAQISQKHCNFIINLGGASASDIEQLIAHAKQLVKTAHGVELQPEIRIIGEGA